MPRPTADTPALIGAALAGAVASVAGGFLIASYTISGITPAYVAPARPERLDPPTAPPSDDWREAGYRRIGVWESSAATGDDLLEHQAAGSSRL